MNKCDRCSSEFTTWMHNLQMVKDRCLCNSCITELRQNAIKRAIQKFEKQEPTELEVFENKRFKITFLATDKDCFSCNEFNSYRVEEDNRINLRVKHYLPNPVFDRSYGWFFNLEKGLI